MEYLSGKTYTHSAGFSACFRQWRAQSHCHYLHGYALQVELTFAAAELDRQNWVVDFGSLRPVKQVLEGLFDHTTLVASDDPKMGSFLEMHEARLIDLRVVHATGCEAFAKLVFDHVKKWLEDSPGHGHARLVRAVVREHEGNWASYGESN